MSDPAPQMPRDFGWRWIAWIAWCNAISILSTSQAIFAALALDSDSFSPHAIRGYMIANAVLTVIVSQIKKNRPPGPPPLQKDTK